MSMAPRHLCDRICTCPHRRACIGRRANTVLVEQHRKDVEKRDKDNADAVALHSDLKVSSDESARKLREEISSLRKQLSESSSSSSDPQELIDLKIKIAEQNIEIKMLRKQAKDDKDIPSFDGNIKRLMLQQYFRRLTIGKRSYKDA